MARTAVVAVVSSGARFARAAAARGCRPGATRSGLTVGHVRIGASAEALSGALRGNHEADHGLDSGDFAVRRHVTLVERAGWELGEFQGDGDEIVVVPDGLLVPVREAGAGGLVDDVEDAAAVGPGQTEVCGVRVSPSMKVRGVGLDDRVDPGGEQDLLAWIGGR